MASRGPAQVSTRSLDSAHAKDVSQKFKLEAKASSERGLKRAKATRRSAADLGASPTSADPSGIR